MDEIELIPTEADSYDSLTFVHTKCACVYKRVGYTPLQVVRSITPYLLPEEVSKCTYVGRLDPMAEGWMHILWNGDMEEKQKIASSDKIYEIEVLFGISTDTGDVLGMVTEHTYIAPDEKQIRDAIQSFVGPFTYPYPKYSSPNIKKTLEDEENENVKLQKGSISKIAEMGFIYIDKADLEKEILQKLSLSNMDGDFRLEQIEEKWKYFFAHHAKDTYQKVKLHVYCSSGTYMRTLSEELGNKITSSSFASSIKRIGITYCA